MKKLVLILALLLALTVVLGLPAAIGRLLHNGLSDTISENLPAAEVEWDRGWFRSGVRIEDKDFRARLDFRHAPLGPPGWISVQGLVTLTAPAATIDLTARLALDGSLALAASAPTLDMPGPVAWQYRAPIVRLDAGRDGEFEFHGAAESLLVVDGIGNRLSFVEPVLEASAQTASDRTSTARLTLETRRLGQQESRLALDLASVDRAAFGELVEALRQLSAAPPDSPAAGLGAIGAASAWQQLVAGGLRMEIEELVLDNQLSLSGQWQPNDKSFSLTGEGERATLLDWWTNIVGLAGQLPPEQARMAASQGLQDLAARGAITTGRDRISVNLQSLPPAAGR